MTKKNDINRDTDVTYRTVNLFSCDKRFILSASFLMFHILRKEHETVYTILVKIDRYT